MNRAFRIFPILIGFLNGYSAHAIIRCYPGGSVTQMIERETDWLRLTDDPDVPLRSLGSFGRAYLAGDTYDEQSPKLVFKFESRESAAITLFASRVLSSLGIAVPYVRTVSMESAYLNWSVHHPVRRALWYPPYAAPTLDLSRRAFRRLSTEFATRDQYAPATFGENPVVLLSEYLPGSTLEQWMNARIPGYGRRYSGGAPPDLRVQEWLFPEVMRQLREEFSALFNSDSTDAEGIRALFGQLSEMYVASNLMWLLDSHDRNIGIAPTRSQGPLSAFIFDRTPAYQISIERFYGREPGPLPAAVFHQPPVYSDLSQHAGFRNFLLGFVRAPFRSDLAALTDRALRRIAQRDRLSFPDAVYQGILARRDALMVEIRNARASQLPVIH